MVLFFLNKERRSSQRIGCNTFLNATRPREWKSAIITRQRSPKGGDKAALPRDDAKTGEAAFFRGGNCLVSPPPALLAV